MALVVKDRVKQTTTTTGTGSIVLNGNVAGFQTFAAALTNGDTTYYSIFETSTNAFEVGLGTWNESTSTLARTTVLESSNSGNAINLTAQAEVFITYPAEKSVFLDSTGDVTLGNDLTVTGDFTVNGTTTTINSTNKVLTDALIELANGTTGTPSNDSGVIIERGDSDNAFIGFDESEDKFIVGTGSFTGASTGNLTINTGTLVANVEGNVTGNVTGNVSGSAATVTTAAQPNITSLGTLTTLTVDDITINGSTISDAGDLTVDVGGDIILDADGADITLKDDGTSFGKFTKSGNNFVIESQVSDGDLVISGNDGGTPVSALTFDMSEAGAASFNSNVSIGGSGVFGTGNSTFSVGNDDFNQLTIGKSSGDGGGITFEATSDTGFNGLLWSRPAIDAFARFQFNHSNADFEFLIGPNLALSIENNQVNFHSNVLSFEGSTDDDNETLVNVINPTQDNVISFPNESGTLATRATAAAFANLLG